MTNSQDNHDSHVAGLVPFEDDNSNFVVSGKSSPWTSLAAMTSRDEAHPGARASRPHNTGMASSNSSTRLDRQRRHDSTSWITLHSPPFKLHATVVHAGGTPALPGGVHPPSLLLLMGRRTGLTSRHAWWPFVVLRGPSWITLFWLSQAGRGCRGGRRWTGSA